MKNFLIEFFRPFDNLIFKYLTKAGFVKPIFGQILGAAIASRGASKARKASEAAEARSRGDLQRAFEQIRDPNEILRDAYGAGGIFGADTQGDILEAEQRLLPGFLDLQRQQAQMQLLGQGGLMDLGQQARLNELGFIGAFAPAARGLLEDPRLAAIADADLDAALNPLSGERARAAEQSALADAVRMGRGRGQGAIAQLALGRSAATDAARLRALQSAQIARIDPTALLGGLTPRVDALSGAFLSQAPGTLVTDPGQAINVGSATDVQRANVLMGQGALAAQAAAARSGIAGDQMSTLGTLFSSALNRGNQAQTPVSGIQSPTQSAGFGGLTGNPATSIFGGGLTGDPTTNIFSNFLGSFGR
jgi:hypothetical protein